MKLKNKINLFYIMGGCGSSKTSSSSNVIQAENSKGMYKPIDLVVQIDKTSIILECVVSGSDSVGWKFSKSSKSTFELADSDIDKINSEIGDELTPAALWDNPDDLMYEKIYDKEYLHRNEASLLKEGITGFLFKDNVTKAISKHLKGVTKDIYTKNGPFKYRKIEWKDAGLDGKDDKLKISPLQKLGKFLYFGQTENDKPHGRGIALYSDGSVYEGFWHEGQRHLSGRLILSHCHTKFGVCAYQGEWFKDTIDDCFGVAVKTNGYGVKCTWNNATADGEGFEVIQNQKEFYRATFKEGFKDGQGKLHWEDGANFEGDLRHNKMEGKGEYNYKNGRKYVGDFHNNMMHGKGVFTWQQGLKYEGEYHLGEKHGYGVFDWGDGQLYKGEWKDGKQHGPGVFVDKDKTEKQGRWEKGKCVDIKE